MIWIYLGVFIVLMTAPFLLSWHYTGEKKRTILAVPCDTNDVPFRNAIGRDTDSEDVIELDSLVAPAESIYEKPLYIKDNASFGKNAKLFAVHAKTLTISEQSHVASSLCADEYLSVGEGCELLGSAECDGNMDIADGTSFYDLFARRIRFFGGAYEAGSDSEAIKDLMAAKKPDEVVRNIRNVKDQEIIEKTVITRRGLHVGKNAVIKGDVLAVTKVKMDEGSSIGGNMISKKTMTVGKSCCVIGDISTEKDIELEDGAVIFGSVISQKNVKVGPGCHIKGNVFAQECIEIHENVIIGTEGQIKSVVAGDSISILGSSTVYGRVRAGRGAMVTK